MTQHERIVQRLVNQSLQAGAPPSSISISAQQNPSLEKWAKRKGIVFDRKQKVDIISPDRFG